MTRWLAVLVALAVGCGGVTAATVPTDGGGSAGAGGASGTAGAAGTADGAAAKVGSGAAGTGAGTAGTTGTAGSSAGTAGTTGAGNTTGAGGTSPACPRSGQMLCGGQCASVFTDPDNCGACYRACSAGQSCTNGVCTGSGVGGASGAGNTTGTGNSTGAGNAMGSGNASGAGGSTECTGGAVACNGTCVNANASDAQNCGGCGARCPSGSKCNLGKCWDMASGQRTLVTWPACPLNGSTRTSSSCNLMTSDGGHSCGLCVSGYDTSATPCLGSLLCVSSCANCP